MNRRIGQRPAMTADEHMVIAGTEFAAAYQVAPQPRGRGVVQWHQAGFSELGFPNQQAIIRDVCKSQPQRLGNTQPGGSQQRDQSGVCLSSDRATRTESTGGFEKAADFVGRINVRHAACLAVPKVIRRRQLVPIIFDADVTGEPADRFKPLVAPCRGCPLSGPIDRGLRADVDFVPLGGKSGEAVQQVFRICHLQSPLRGAGRDRRPRRPS